MPSKKRSASQARKDRAALKRLQKSGLYKGKIDARKAPTKRQRELIDALRSSAKSSSRLSGKAGKRGKEKQPLPPKSRSPAGKVTRKRVQREDLEQDIGKHPLTTYALPFLRRGQDEPEWRRFTSQQLRKFLAEYKEGDEEGAAEWRSYAVRETWTFKTKTERSEFRRETDLFFSGIRIDAPRASQSKTAKSRTRLSAKGRKRGKPGTKRSKRR